MKYVHDSPVGCHGHLRSDVCLIDSRWVLKVADIGVTWLRYASVENQSVHERYRGTSTARVRTLPRYERYRCTNATDLLTNDDKVLVV